jgi:hypothetical protein
VPVSIASACAVIRSTMAANARPRHKPRAVGLESRWHEP